MTHPEDSSQNPDATASGTASPLPRRRAALAVGSALVLGGIALAIWAVTATGSSDPQVAAPSMAASASSPGTAGDSPAAESPAAFASAASTPPAASAKTPVISAFSVEPAVAACPDDRASTVPLTFSWTTAGAERAWIGIATSDAAAQPAAEVDLTSAGFSELAFACSVADQVFTLTVQAAGGTVSETIAIPRELD